MLKKVGMILCLLMFLLTINLFSDSQSLVVKKGWNLTGTYLNNVLITNFSTNSISTIWKWENNSWKVWSPNTKIMEIISSYGLQPISGFSAGDGFWINATADATIDLQGVKDSDINLNFEKGWNLLSPKSENGISIDVLKNVQNIVTVWQWSGSGWNVWSPLENVMKVISNYGLQVISFIKAGEGFWLSAGNSGEINNGIETPPSPGFVYALAGKLNTIPLPNADVYINGEYKGKTDEKGSFDFSGYSDGSLVMVKKKGYVTVYGKIKNGKVLLVTESDYSSKIPFEPTNGTMKPAKKAITSQDGSVSIVVNGYKTDKGITVSVVPFMSTSVIPEINDITINGQKISAKQLVAIGGAFINVEDEKGNLITGDDLKNIEVNFKSTQTKFLGDLDQILNGFTDVPSKNFQSFAEDAYNKLMDSINKGMVSLYYLKFEDGQWKYVGDAEIKKYEKKKKLDNGSIITYYKYKLVGPKDVYDTSLAPYAFVLRLNYLTGEVTVCATEGGYKMFDGTVVTKEQSDAEKEFDWIGKSIPNASVIGDDAIVSPPGFTDENGCITLTYKVPFVSPTFSISFKKDGYFDSIVNCTATVDGAKCDKGIMFRMPDTASIKGYVRNKLTKEPIEKALVTLVNPEVLTAEKIKSGIYDDGNAYVKVGYNPTVEYTWSIKKDNKTFIIKENCKDSPSCAEITKKEIFDKIIKPYDDNDPDNNPLENPTGTWELVVKAVHKFTNTDKVLVESAFGSFNIDILNAKLSEYLTGNLSEKKEEVIVYDNGTQTTLPTGLKTAAVYGGFSLGYLYEYGAQNDMFKWTTDIVADSSDDFGECIEGITIDDPIANANELCYQHVTPNILVYKKSLFPMGFNIKFLDDNFPYLLKPDKANNDKPFFKSGFTIRTIFEGTIDMTDLGQDNITQYLVSYMDLPEDAIPTLSAILDIPQIKLVGESVTAYLRQAFTDENGFYQINLIPPTLSGKLEVFAKAEGYKFDANTDIKLVDDLKAGYVSEYDLYLEPAGEIPSPPTTWDGWEFKSSCSVASVKWQVVDKPEDIYIKNTDWLEAMGYATTDKVGLLPDKDTNTSGYLWFGDVNTSMFTDKSQFSVYSNESSGTVCGMAISPVFDLSNYSFPVLNFDSWFEVESVDVAKGQFDQLNVGFMIVSDNDSPITVYNSNGDEVVLQPNQFYSLELLNPDSEPDIQSATVPYSNQGVNAVPVWEEYSIPVDMLAGYKVKFVFYFNSMDSLYNGFRGWGVDSVKVVDDMNKVIEYPPQPPQLTPISNEATSSALQRKISN